MVMSALNQSGPWEGIDWTPYCALSARPVAESEADSSPTPAPRPFLLAQYALAGLAPMKRNISPHATASQKQLQTSGDARARTPARRRHPRAQAVRSQQTELQRCATTIHRPEVSRYLPLLLLRDDTGSSTATPKHPRDGPDQQQLASEAHRHGYPPIVCAALAGT